jgi:hypothetical protein
MEVSNVSFPEELKPILTQNGGMFTTAQANKVGVSKERLRLLVKSTYLYKAFVEFIGSRILRSM